MRFAPTLLLALALAACGRPPGDLRDWRPEDHDHTTNPGEDQVVSGPDAGPSPGLAKHGLDEVTIIAWQQNCTRCHGEVGRGDGPQSAMFHPTDLTNPVWQKSVTDEQVAQTIKNGRGAMPPFKLPDSTITTLVRLVRLLDASRHKEAASADPDESAAPDASGAPRASASPHGSVAPRSSGGPPKPPVPAASGGPRGVPSSG